MSLSKSVNSIFLALLVTLTSTYSFALPSDKEQPIHIKSDTAEIDDAKGISIYRGNVNIDQGSINLTAEVVTIYNTKQGISKVIAVGNPAHYRQQSEIDEPLTHAFGDTINYFLTDERIELRKNAKLEQQQDYFTGDRIDYDMKNRVVNAYSDNTDARVNMVLQPKKNSSDQNDGETPNP
ncbi:MAG: lipopolysaccharide transport periplasmic protein LptA [Pseudomonadales bacterium]|nr:lipopolysaccharide transport periplasmic protein LptA [Pseudomonadales bacterium]